MKYKTENEFCRETTKILLGLSVGSGREVIAVPEVPWGYFSNEQFDMLLLDVKNLEYLQIEFKLTDRKSLSKQVQRLGRAVGIINTETPGPPYFHIAGFTGEDAQIENIDRMIFSGHSHVWWSAYQRYGMIYYWAYKNNKSDLDGGIVGGSRDGFAAVYVKAIRNLHRHYGKLDFMITHAALNSGYSVAVSRKYYNQAVWQG